MAQEVRRVEDLLFDEQNANAGTERGRAMLERSLREAGAGRSIVVDQNGRVIAGNKTLEVAEAIGLPIIVVRTDGSELVVVQRTDLDLDDARARRLAYYDNRTSEVGLSWDATRIVADLEKGLDLSGLFEDDEVEALVALARDMEEQWEEAFGGLPDGEKPPFQQMAFILHDSQIPTVKAALAKAKGMMEGAEVGSENGDALSCICETFVSNYGQS